LRLQPSGGFGKAAFVNAKRQHPLPAENTVPRKLAPLTGQALASIEDPVVIKQILTHLQRKAEPKEFNPLPESRAPPQIGLFG